MEDIYMNIISKWLKKSKSQTTFCYCPNCGLDLCGQKNIIMTDTDLVRYICSCGVLSVWNFDAPVPLNVR
jgi:hypothetical protein